MNRCGKDFTCCWCTKKKNGDLYLQYIDNQHCQKCENPKVE